MTRSQYPFEFACQRSGNCCAIPGGVVRVGAADIAAIAGHLGMSETAVRRRYLDLRGDRLRDGFGSRCVFLDDGPPGQAGCRIYPVRPQKCRDWPFWPEALTDPELLAAMRRRCPGIGPRRSPDRPPSDEP